jgi:hypothetical protein
LSTLGIIVRNANGQASGITTKQNATAAYAYADGINLTGITDQVTPARKDPRGWGIADYRSDINGSLDRN